MGWIQISAPHRLLLKCSKSLTFTTKDWQNNPRKFLFSHWPQGGASILAEGMASVSVHKTDANILDSLDILSRSLAAGCAPVRPTWSILCLMSFAVTRMRPLWVHTALGAVSPSVLGRPSHGSTEHPILQGWDGEARVLSLMFWDAHPWGQRLKGNCLGLFCQPLVVKNRWFWASEPPLVCQEWYRDLHPPHVTVEDVEAQRGCAVCPQSRRSQARQQTLDPRVPETLTL